MKSAGVIRLESQGNSRLLVMPFESHTGTDEHESDKIIVRSNGTVTYTAGHRLSTLETWTTGARFQLQAFSRLPGWTCCLGDYNRSKCEVLPEVPRPNFGGGVKVYT